MLIDLALFVMLGMLMIPVISGYYAHTQGRSFWLWFLIGIALPGISYIILIMLPSKKNPVEREIEQLRIRHRMLGTSPDIPQNDPLRSRILSAPISNFAIGIEADGEVKRLRLLIDGQDLLDIVARIEKKLASPQEAPGDYMRLPLTLALPPYKHLLGEPSLRYGQQLQCALLAGKSMRKPLDWAFTARISIYRRVVVWHSFMQTRKGEAWSYRPLTILVFDRFQYEEAIRQLEVLNQ